MDKRKEELIELSDTINDTPIFKYDNITPKSINSKIIISSSTETQDIIYSNNFSNINDNSFMLNEIKMEKKPENKILFQRENRRIISIIKQIIAKKESEDITKEKIKNMLISYKNDITLLKDDKKNSLLHIYVEESDINAINIILQVYLDILKRSKNYYYFLFSKNIENNNIFDISVQKGNITIIKLLYEQIEKEDNYNEKRTYMKYFRDNIFIIAAKNNNIFPILFFYEKLTKFYNKRDNYNNIEGILDIHEINEDKLTPIHYACKNNNIKLMNILIDLGANINIQDGKGYTPLHHAVINNDERMIKHLLIRGADKFIKDQNNVTPYDLSSSLGEENLSKILYHKSFCKRYFCGDEIGPLSKKNNMRCLLFGLIFTLIIKFFNLFIYYCLYNNIFHNFSLFFSETSKKYVLYEKKIFKAYSLKKYFNCLEDNCRIEVGLLFISLGIDLFLLVIFIIFKCSKEIFLEQKKESNKSLSKLYEENENICVKCHIHINKKTQHCLICDRCVENWDHHCFWLNTCINNKNYTKFKIFMTFAILFLFFNLFFYVDSFYLFISARDSFTQGIFKLNKGSILYKVVKIGIICVLIYFIINISYSLFFVVLPIIKYIYSKSVKNSRNINKNEKDTNYNSLKNIIDNENDDDEININTSIKGF